MKVYSAMAAVAVAVAGCDLPERVDALEAKASQLEAKANALDARVAKLETGAPTPGPGPTPNPTPIEFRVPGEVLIMESRRPPELAPATRLTEVWIALAPRPGGKTSWVVRANARNYSVGGTGGVRFQLTDANGKLIATDPVYFKNFRERCGDVAVSGHGEITANFVTVTSKARGAVARPDTLSGTQTGC